MSNQRQLAVTSAISTTSVTSENPEIEQRKQLPTLVYAELEMAYQSMNLELFGQELPELLFTLTRKANSLGYYKPSAAINRDSSRIVSEIAINPDWMIGRSPEDILSTLLHEMCHAYQDLCCGNHPRNGYHDKAWGETMDRVGLVPSDTGKPGGKRTGQRMTHYVDPQGAFAVWYARNWLSYTFWWGTIDAIELGPIEPVGSENGENGENGSTEPTKAKKNSKTKFMCPHCGSNAWAKPDAVLFCGTCITAQFDKQLMLGFNRSGTAREVHAGLYCMKPA